MGVQLRIALLLGSGALPAAERGGVHAGAGSGRVRAHQHPRHSGRRSASYTPQWSLGLALVDVRVLPLDLERKRVITRLLRGRRDDQPAFCQDPI